MKNGTLGTDCRELLKEPSVGTLCGLATVMSVAREPGGATWGQVIMFIRELFTKNKLWNQPGCPPTDE